MNDTLVAMVKVVLNVTLLLNMKVMVVIIMVN